MRVRQRVAQGAALAAAMLLSSAALAQGKGEAAPADAPAFDDGEQPAAAPEGGGGVAIDQIPVGEACDWPVDLLWHRESKETPWQMGVSVLNKASGQQAPGLAAEHFNVLLDGEPVAKGDGFQVRQSAAAFVVPGGEEGGEEQPPTDLGVDPINYDVYFAIDMTKSMGETLQPEGMNKPFSKLNLSLRVVNRLVQPPRQGSSALFDERDRVYISGFTSKLETGFMASTTADRGKIRDALTAMNEVEPSGDSAALYAAVLHHLRNIQAQAAEYSDPEKKREAVLIVITDSFNGMDLEGRRPLKYCSKNDELTDAVQQAVLDTQTATDGNLKLYILAIGGESEPEHYSLTEPPHRRCRINRVEKETLDGRSLRVIGNRDLTRGGYRISENPLELMSFIISRFEALKSAYEVTYTPPEGVSRARSFAVTVQVGEALCIDSEVISSNIIPQARGSDVKTTPGEFALFLAGLLIASLFLPRSLSNLFTLGSGGGRPAPPKKRKKKKRRR